MRKYTLNDLPAHSPWPARLLGLNPWRQRSKTRDEVLREYEKEKWGPLLAALGAAPIVTLRKVDRMVFRGVPPQLCSIGESLKLLAPIEAHKKHVALVASTLRRFHPFASLAELGAGYGSVILRLARHPLFRRARFFAGDFAASGAKLARRIASSEHIEITVGRCDFTAVPMTNLVIPHGAVIFTSMATPYVPRLPPSFVDQLISFRPRAVVHVEPCYEHCDARSLLGAMRKRYIEVNDYNRNLVTLLRTFEAQRKIRIVSEEPAVFGANALLSSSVIAWTPRQKIGWN